MREEEPQCAFEGAFFKGHFSGFIIPKQGLLHLQNTRRRLLNNLN